MHWCRYVMDQETKLLVSNLPYNTFDAVEISGGHWKNFGFKTYDSYRYPSFDICNITSKHIESADIVLVEQVFEHVKNPWRAAENINRILKPNGYLLVTTPFFLKVHGAPVDYWRWTQSGLCVMLEECGFHIETVNSWGNRDCVSANFDQWADYHDGLNLQNEKDFPVVVWALAKK
jgi:SAM-dependent methyltransferase